MKVNGVLKKKNNELNEIVLKFTNREKMLDNMLNSQKCVFDKRGIGYKANYYKNYFVKVPLLIIKLYVIIAIKMSI